MPFLERRITSFDNLSLYLRDYGNPLDPRVPLFCLGGLTRNSKDFESLAERYSSDGRRVICPDYRGRGQSQASSPADITRLVATGSTAALCPSAA